MFDLRLLSSGHFWLLLGSFSVTYGVISQWRSRYAGVVPATVSCLLSWFVIDSVSLKLGLTGALVAISVAGRADETQPLSAGPQLLWQLVIGATLAFSGWTIPHVTNFSGTGVINLGLFSIPLTIAWFVLMMNAINWLDGIDGLAALVSTIGLLTLAGVSLLPATQDSTTLSLALIGAGSMLAFFLHNTPPARVYLGTIGSWYGGMFLALTAAAGGGKVATTSLVLALPVLDALFVIAERVVARQRPWVGDKKHLHYRLQNRGWKVPHILIAAGGLSAALGIIAVTAQTYQKMWALALVALFLLLTILSLSYRAYVHSNPTHR